MVVGSILVAVGGGVGVRSDGVVVVGHVSGDVVVVRHGVGESVDGLGGHALLEHVEGLLEVLLGLHDVLSVIHVHGGALDRGELGVLSHLGSIERLHEHLLGLLDLGGVLDGDSDSGGDESSDSNLK